MTEKMPWNVKPLRPGYFAARRAGAYLVCTLIASRSLRTGKHPAVRLKRQPVLDGPLVIQHWIVRKLQQRGCNFLCLRHPFVYWIKASFFACTLGICCVSQPPDVSVAPMESTFADI